MKAEKRTVRRVCRNKSKMLLLAVGVALPVLLGGCGAPQGGTVASADPVLAAEFTVGPDAPLPLLPVTVDGQAFTFVLDTGSSHMVLDRSFKSRLGQPIKMVETLTPGGPIEHPLYAMPPARLGPISLADTGPVLVSDLEMLRRVSGRDIQGILGIRQLARHAVVIDGETGTVSLLDSERARPTDWPAQTPIRLGPLGLPHVQADLAGLGAVPMVIDSGDTSDGALHRKVVKELAQVGDVPTASSLSETFSGTVVRRNLRVRGLSVAGLEYPPLLLSASGHSNLGWSWLKRHTVRIDMPRKRLYLRPNRLFDRRDELDMSGLHILQIDGATLVHSVDQSSPADQAGIRRSDELLWIDGQRADQMDIYEIRRRLASGDGRQVKIIYGRGGKRFPVTLTLRKRI